MRGLKRLANGLSLTALMVTSMPATADAPSGRNAGAGRQGSGLCRNAPPLARLPAEPRYDPRQQRSYGGGDEIVTTAARVERGKAADRTMEAPAMAAPSPSAPPPPAPPPPPAASAADAATAEGRMAPSGIVPPGWPRPGPSPQAGILTAGEHDDLLNPELYARYVRQSDVGQAVRDLPVLDTGRVLTVAVKDAAGQPAPFARVTLTCADGNRLTMLTQADGNAVFFPGLDRLGSAVSVAVSYQGQGTPSRQVSISGAAGSQQIGITLGARALPARKLDLVLAIDTTGSMGDEIRYLQSELRAILDDIRASHAGLDLRVGFVFYRDLGDDYVTLTQPLTADFKAAQASLAQQYAAGGGDYPEAMDQAMIRAVGLDWRPDAIKSLLLVADAPPHDDKVGATWAAAEAARARRIHIVPVAASGVADTAEYAMRAMAALTQSRYVFLTDDSGVGNPHAPPAIDCYQVTRLDALLRRVIDSQLSGRRVEARGGEVIRTVGTYDAGRCVLPRNFSQRDFSQQD